MSIYIAKKPPELNKILHLFFMVLTPLPVYKHYKKNLRFSLDNMTMFQKDKINKPGGTVQKSVSGQ